MTNRLAVDSAKQVFKPQGIVTPKLSFDRVEVFDNRIEYIQGPLQRDRQTIYFSKITNVRVKKALIGDRATIWLDTAGQGGFELVLESYPKILAVLLQERVGNN